jgi:hypothetical protein
MALHLCSPYPLPPGLETTRPQPLRTRFQIAARRDWLLDRRHLQYPCPHCAVLRGCCTIRLRVAKHSRSPEALLQYLPCASRYHCLLRSIQALLPHLDCAVPQYGSTYRHPRAQHRGANRRRARRTQAVATVEEGLQVPLLVFLPVSCSVRAYCFFWFGCPFMIPGGMLGASRSLATLFFFRVNTCCMKTLVCWT